MLSAILNNFAELGGERLPIKLSENSMTVG